MRVFRLIPLLLLAATTLLAVPLAGAAQQEEQTEPIVIPVEHSQSGTGPCGFTIQRDLEGSVSVIPSIGPEGNFVLTIEDVDLRGTITNPANDRVVEILWVRQEGLVGFHFEDGSSHVLLELVGTLNRGYDTADSDLTLDLPSDLAEMIPFVPQERNEEAWSHVCAFLS